MEPDVAELASLSVLFSDHADLSTHAGFRLCLGLDGTSYINFYSHAPPLVPVCCLCE